MEVPGQVVQHDALGDGAGEAAQLLPLHGGQVEVAEAETPRPAQLPGRGEGGGRGHLDLGGAVVAAAPPRADSRRHGPHSLQRQVAGLH